MSKNSTCSGLLPLHSEPVIKRKTTVIIAKEDDDKKKKKDSDKEKKSGALIGEGAGALGGLGVQALSNLLGLSGSPETSKTSSLQKISGWGGSALSGALSGSLLGGVLGGARSLRNQRDWRDGFSQDILPGAGIGAGAGALYGLLHHLAVQSSKLTEKDIKRLLKEHDAPKTSKS